jgi:hypothetical protein
MTHNPEPATLHNMTHNPEPATLHNMNLRDQVMEMTMDQLHGRPLHCSYDIGILLQPNPYDTALSNWHPLKTKTLNHKTPTTHILQTEPFNTQLIQLNLVHATTCILIQTEWIQRLPQVQALPCEVV